MIVPALMLSWLRFGKREPFPEYTSPNTYVKWLGVNNEVLDLQTKLIDTFTAEQLELYHQLREKKLEADREEPWQDKELSVKNKK